MHQLQERLGEIPKDKLILVSGWDTWCNLGPQACAFLLENGFDAKEMIGGLAAWKAMRLPIAV